MGLLVVSVLRLMMKAQQRTTEGAALSLCQNGV